MEGLNQVAAMAGERPAGEIRTRQKCEPVGGPVRAIAELGHGCSRGELMEVVALADQFLSRDAKACDERNSSFKRAIIFEIAEQKNRAAAWLR